MAAIDLMSQYHVASSDAETIKKRSPVGSYLVGVITVILLATMVYGLATNRNLSWPVFIQFLTDSQIMAGLGVTLQLSFYALLIGLVLGSIVALSRMSQNPALAMSASFYVWFLRGLPAIVQLLFWGNIALFVSEISVGIPFTDTVFFTVKVSSYITPFVAALLGLGLAESAYMSEIIRGGIKGVDRGQFEAAAALGMTKGRLMMRIVLPQAMRSIIPNLGNQFANIVKTSALVAVIAGGDLLTTAQNIAAQNYRMIEMLFVASFWYLVVLAITGLIQGVLERRMRKAER